MNIFSGYRLFPGVGWIRNITARDYSEDENWKYFDTDGKTKIIIAYRQDRQEFAWVEDEDVTD